jgi:hypothetical protein
LTFADGILVLSLLLQNTIILVVMSQAQMDCKIQLSDDDSRVQPCS